MDKVRVAFIGGGGLANSMHYPSLSSMEDVEIVAIAEMNEERLQTTADKYEVEGRFTSHLEMLEKAEPDAVYCIMPPMHLWGTVNDCLERGMHVFTEKPPGMTTTQTSSWARLAEKKGLLTMCGFNRRHIPCLKQAKKKVEERGPIIQCMATFVKFYKNDFEYYGGAIDILTCDAVHAVDSLRWLGGEVDRLASDIGRFGTDYPNSFNTLMKFESGAVGFLVANWAVGGRVHTWEIHAHGISAYVDPDTTGAHIHIENKPNEGHLDPVESAGSEERHIVYGFFGESRHFIDCIKSGDQPVTHFGDAVKTMELVERIYNGQI